MQLNKLRIESILYPLLVIEESLRTPSDQLLFSKHPPRLKVVATPSPRNAAPIRINVWRNHGAEQIFDLVSGFLRGAGVANAVELSSYDDSLSFSDRQEADVEVVWIDQARYHSLRDSGEFLQWLDNRVSALRGLSTAPILVITWLEKTPHDDPRFSASGVHLALLNDLPLPEPLVDVRLEGLTASRLSTANHTEIARWIALRWLAALLLPPVKAVAMDLDGTMYQGVLGEDGAEGVHITNGHIALYRELEALVAAGVFVSVVSKNVVNDVENLFRTRSEIGPRWDELVYPQISWDSKAVMCERLARALNIDISSILLVDDNPGEVASYLAFVPDGQVVLTSGDPEDTLRILKFFPGLWRWTISDSSSRLQDVRAATERTLLERSSASRDAYLRDLGMELTVGIDCQADIPRVSELLRKTNQFNTALHRMSEAQIASAMADSNTKVAAVRLADRFADSGTIAALVIEHLGNEFKVVEACISCRALGRGIETEILALALGAACQDARTTIVQFLYSPGPRNGPARDWLEELSGQKLTEAGIVEVPSDSLKIYPEQRLSEWRTT